MQRFIHYLFLCIFFLIASQNIDAQTVRIEIRTEGRMSEINSIDDRCQGPSGYSCNTCCGRQQFNTDCDDCNGPPDIDMYARFTVNGSNGGIFSIGNNNGNHQGCGWASFNGFNSVYTADRPYGSNIGVALGGRENDNGFLVFVVPMMETVII